MNASTSTSQITSKAIAAQVRAGFEENLSVLPTDAELNFIAAALNKELSEITASFLSNALTPTKLKKLHAAFLKNTRKGKAASAPDAESAAPATKPSTASVTPMRRAS